MVAVFGTMVADVLHVELGVPYLVSTVVFAVVLAAVFVLWYATQRTLSVHSIDTFPRQVFYWCAVLATFALALVAERVPALKAIRVLSPRAVAEPTPPRASQAEAAAPLEVGQAELTQESEGTSVDQAPPSAPPASAITDKPPPLELDDASGRALAGFFDKLAQSERKQAGAITRIAYFGDSIVVSDLVSGTLRRLLQQRFGDSGHGFSLIANAWPSYVHFDVERYATAGWKVSRIVGPLAADGFYGLGCVSFSAEKNVLARFSTVSKGDFGRNVSRFGISYLSSATGGSFDVSIDGHFVEHIDTRSDATRSMLREFELPDGPHKLELLTKSGISRLFGVTMERSTPGVVLDAIGIQGARVRFLDKQDDAHWAEQLQQRSPDLLVYQFGANESADGLMYSMADYHRTFRNVVEQGRRALPNAGCLIVGPLDRATKKGEELVSVGVIPLLVKEQREVAAETGCAFFDTYHAMGGGGSMARWLKRGLGQADMTHPSGAGAEIIGAWIFRALMQRYGAAGAGTKSAPNSAPTSSSPSRR